MVPARLFAEGPVSVRRRLQTAWVRGLPGGGWAPFRRDDAACAAGDPIFKGIFEGNDRRKRLMVIINDNTDVSQFWKWSGRGLRPLDQTNEAYKLGVNYLIYGLTH
jgi:uncharacterized protein DUF4159